LRGNIVDVKIESTPQCQLVTGAESIGSNPISIFDKSIIKESGIIVNVVKRIFKEVIITFLMYIIVVSSNGSCFAIVYN